MQVNLFAFNLKMAKDVAALMRSRGTKVRYLDAAMFSGEREGGLMLLVRTADEAEHPKADDLKAMPGVVVVEIKDPEDVKTVAKAAAVAAANAIAEADKAEAGEEDEPGEPAPKPAKVGKPAHPPKQPDPGDGKKD